MAYAEVADVRARAGVLSPAFNQGFVAEAEIERFLDDAAGEIDARVATAGFATPLTDVVATNALRALNADGALVVAIAAKWPDGNDGAKTLLERASKRWEAGLEALASGEATVLEYLSSLVSSPGSTDFWTENPGYGRVGDPSVDPLTTNPYLAPGIARTDRF